MVEWFVNKILTLENIALEYFETNNPLEIEEGVASQESFQQSTICWLCEQPFTEYEQPVRDHDHLTGKYRGAAHNKCNLNCKQKSSSFNPIFFHNFSWYDCHLMFEELLTQAYKLWYEPNIIPKSMENYVGVQVGCLRFLDSYRFLNSSLDKLMKSMQSGANNFPIMTIEGMSDELFKKKLAYPYEYFTHNNFQEPLNLSPEDFCSTLKQTAPPDEAFNRTQEINKRFNVKNRQELTELYLKMDVLQLAEVLENFVEKATLEYSINPLYSYSLPGYTWKAGLKLTNIKLDFIKDKDLLLLLLLENNIRGGISSVM